MNLDNLKKIKRVEVSPYLFTRIKQKIESEKQEIIPNNIAWTINLSFAVLILINIAIFVGSNTKLNETESYAQSINFISNNALYK